jgi:hypothetical protein
MVCSIPKAGTYLLAELLKELGADPTGFHMMRNSVSDYSHASLDAARNDHQRFTVSKPFVEVLTKIRPGQFAVSHLDAATSVQQALAGFHVIFLYRELRATFISHMRFFAGTKRETPGKALWRDLPDGPKKALAAFDDFGAAHFAICQGMIDWLDAPGALAIAFETLLGDHGRDEALRVVHQLVEVCGLRRDEHTYPGAVLASIRGRETMTWSGARTDVGRYWTQALEDRFRAIGGVTLNERLGYVPRFWTNMQCSVERDMSRLI